MKRPIMAPHKVPLTVPAIPPPPSWVAALMRSPVAPTSPPMSAPFAAWCPTRLTRRTRLDGIIVSTPFARTTSDVADDVTNFPRVDAPVLSTISIVVPGATRVHNCCRGDGGAFGRSASGGVVTVGAARSMPTGLPPATYTGVRPRIVASTRAPMPAPITPKYAAAPAIVDPQLGEQLAPAADIPTVPSSAPPMIMPFQTE